MKTELFTALPERISRGQTPLLIKSFTPSKRLEKRHKEDWQKSGISMQSIRTLGVKTNETNDGWVVPVKDLKGNPIGYRARYDEIAIRENRYPGSQKHTPRYRSSSEMTNAFFYPHISSVNWEEIARNKNYPIYITEGEKKATRLTEEGFSSIGLFGVDCWLMRRENQTVPINDFKNIRWHDRKVFIVFDADKNRNVQVQESEQRLKAHLETLGANVTVIDLPDDNNAKGVDDFLNLDPFTARTRFEALRLV